MPAILTLCILLFFSGGEIPVGTYSTKSGFQGKNLEISKNNKFTFNTYNCLNAGKGTGSYSLVGDSVYFLFDNQELIRTTSAYGPRSTDGDSVRITVRLFCGNEPCGTGMLQLISEDDSSRFLEIGSNGMLQFYLKKSTEKVGLSTVGINLPTYYYALDCGYNAYLELNLGGFDMIKTGTVLAYKYSLKKNKLVLFSANENAGRETELFKK